MPGKFHKEYDAALEQVPDIASYAGKQNMNAAQVIELIQSLEP